MLLVVETFAQRRAEQIVLACIVGEGSRYCWILPREVRLGL